MSELDFRRFLGIAQGSNYEVQTQLLVAKELKFGKLEEIQITQNLNIEVGKMLRSLIATIPARS